MHLLALIFWSQYVSKHFDFIWVSHSTCLGANEKNYMFAQIITVYLFFGTTINNMIHGRTFFFKYNFYEFLFMPVLFSVTSTFTFTPPYPRYNLYLFTTIHNIISSSYSCTFVCSLYTHRSDLSMCCARDYECPYLVIRIPWSMLYKTVRPFWSLEFLFLRWWF